MEKCQGTASSETNLWVNFAHRNPRDSIVILEEGNQPYPRCPQCDIFFPRDELNQAHSTSVMCWRRLDSNQQRLVVEDTEERMGRIFLA